MGLGGMKKVRKESVVVREISSGPSGDALPQPPAIDAELREVMAGIVLDRILSDPCESRKSLANELLVLLRAALAHRHSAVMERETA